MTRIALLLFFLAAAALRLAYPLDFEYKYDQIYLFERSQRIGVTEPWPTLGMSSGVGTKNPPLSIWIFPVLAKLTQASTPEALTLAQIALNLAALAALGLLILKAISKEKREPWIWAFGIACVNWHQVFYDRVLWSQSVLPIFCVAHLAAFLHRNKRGGSLALGLTGPLLGQIHMPGFYFFGGITTALALLDRRSVHWRAWALGCAIAAIPMLPWIGYLLTQAVPRGGLDPTALLDVTFWANWFAQATGTDFDFRFGTQMKDFLLGPWVDGQATRLVVSLQAICSVVGVAAAMNGIMLGWLIGIGEIQRIQKRIQKRVQNRIQNRIQKKESFEGKSAIAGQPRLSGFFSLLAHCPPVATPEAHASQRSDRVQASSPWSNEALLLTGGFLGFGLLLTLSGFRLYPHYLLTAFPLIPLSLTLALWNAQRIRRTRIVLATLVVAQLLTTALLRVEIHETGGSPQSDHGVVYSRQKR